MTSAPVPALGLDFGTTNSVIAFRTAQGNIQTARYDPQPDQSSHVFRTALSFWRTNARVAVEAGPWAIAQFIAQPEGCRFLQSFKTFAASAAFRSTIIHGKTYRFEDLMAVFLDRMMARAEALPPVTTRLIVGRPVTFAGASPDAALAQSRYDSALRGSRFEEVHYAYEPVAAAFYFAQRLTRDATVLVADFGGGTSDFSIIRFVRARGSVEAHPLAQTGVGVAGDRFDYRIIDNVVSPKLGKGSRYRSFEKRLDVPAHYFTTFARWNQLAIMKSADTLRELRQLIRVSERPDQLGDLLTIIEEDLAYPLYRAISQVKLELSSQEESEFVFRDGPIALRERVTRADFERWIAPDLAEVDGAVSDALERAGVTEAGIDKVFLTGGSSFVPAVRRLFTARFGPETIETGEQLLSIAYGLALIGEEEDLARWTVREAGAP